MVEKNTGGENVERRYEPTLVWLKFTAWARGQEDGDPGHRLQLFLYRKDRGGAYHLHGPKLYWDEDPSDGYFGNCGQDELAENADKIGEVAAYGLSRHRELTLVANGYDEFCRLIGLE